MFLSDLPPSPVPAETIVVTASRGPEERSASPASVTLVTEKSVERLGQPLLADVIALTPSAQLSASGPAGSQAQLRIRGAEANHTLLFIDGIRANDPAAGNEPRFELLGAELGDRIEVVRGPQSALWGSEAIGGVVALRAAPESGVSVLSEAGGARFGRVSARAGVADQPVTLSLAAGLQGARGINALASGPGDRDGYRNAALRGRLDWRTGAVTVSASGFLIRARSDYDGLDLVTFTRADTADESRNRLQAGRLGADWRADGWQASASASRLTSANRNLLADEEQNRTGGERDTLEAQLGRSFATGPVNHRLTGAAEWTRERFTASDSVYGGLTDQRRRRDQSALVAEWRGETRGHVLSLALRRDRFSEFADATTARAGAQIRLGTGWNLAASYGSGIAQPSFFDLYGFFPGSFRGNPDLKPERSRGAEVSLRRSGRVSGAFTLFRQRLTDEIVERFDSTTFLSTVVNAPANSRRQGLELELGYAATSALSLSAHYTYLDAEEPAGRELRRPRHSGVIVADGASGRLSYGASLSHAGTRLDRDFDVFPSRLVRLDPSWTASARIGWNLTQRLELFGRIANALDSRAEDVIGYRREGRQAYAGIRARLGR